MSGRTILVTFAGRRDRMALLDRYAREAMARGLIDEWHVWGFARNAVDSAWLAETYPVVQTTPSQGFDYFSLPRPLSLRGSKALLDFSVRAAHDAHLGLRRRMGAGPSYEIVLGGWGNSASAIRVFDRAEDLTACAARDSQPVRGQVFMTPELLPEFSAAEFSLELGEAGVQLTRDGAALFGLLEPVAPGEFDILYRTGFGANGDWRFSQFSEHGARRFLAGPEPHYPADAMFYTRAYQYYGARREEFSRDILLKCDDDIVYFDLDKLAEFIAFRRAHQEYFLVSANVVNNGVCAFFQQQAGAIPASLMALEMPPAGMCGSLWGSGAKAEALHRYFLAASQKFGGERPPIPWNERISINFVALLGGDLVHIPDLTADDEHDLCYGVRKRARKTNCIFPGFVAAHLSFWKQDAEMDIDGIVAGYEDLAARSLPAPAQRQAI